MKQKEGSGNASKPMGVAAALKQCLSPRSRRQEPAQQAAHEIELLHLQHPGRHDKAGHLWQRLCLGCGVGKSSSNSSFVSALADVYLETPIRPMKKAARQQEATIASQYRPGSTSLSSAPSSVMRMLSGVKSRDSCQWESMQSRALLQHLPVMATAEQSLPSSTCDASFVVHSSQPSHHFSSYHPLVIAAESAADAGWRDFQAWRLLWLEAAFHQHFSFTETDLQRHETDLQQRLHRGSTTTYCGSDRCPSSWGADSRTAEGAAAPPAVVDAGSDWEIFVECPEWHGSNNFRKHRLVLSSISVAA